MANIRIPILSVLLLWPAVALPQALTYADRSRAPSHRWGAPPRWFCRGLDRPPWLRDPEPVERQPVGIGDGCGDCRSAGDPDPGRPAVPVYVAGVRAGLFDHWRDHRAGIRGPRVVISRRSLLLAGVALPAAARTAKSQCVTDTPSVDACWGGVRVTSPPGKTLDLSFMTPGTLPPNVTFTRASTATTYFDSTGTMQTAAANAPRWDYDPVTLALNGLLIEEARTNVLLNSATLSTQSVTVPASVQALSFYGTGTITLSGVFVGTLVGTGPFPARTSLIFTPTAGVLTLTVTGSVLNAQLE